MNIKLQQELSKLTNAFDNMSAEQLAAYHDLFKKLTELGLWMRVEGFTENSIDLEILKEIKKFQQNYV